MSRSDSCSYTDDISFSCWVVQLGSSLHWHRLDLVVFFNPFYSKPLDYVLGRSLLNSKIHSMVYQMLTSFYCNLMGYFYLKKSAFCCLICISVFKLALLGEPASLRIDRYRGINLLQIQVSKFKVYLPVSLSTVVIFFPYFCIWTLKTSLYCVVFCLVCFPWSTSCPACFCLLLFFLSPSFHPSLFYFAFCFPSLCVFVCLSCRRRCGPAKATMRGCGR